jgi:hypothetical protein
MKITYFILAMAVVSMVSCKKDKEEEDDTTTPAKTLTIEIEEPADMQTFALNETVHVHVMVEANYDLHGYEVLMINESSGDTVWSTDAHDHGQSYHIEGDWVNNVSDHSDMLLKVIVEKDHDGNTQVEERHFHCHPM